MADLYITYSIRERHWVSKLVANLESEGYSVWWDHAVVPGHNFRSESQRALTRAKCVLAIWSETAVEDHWVLVDSEQASQRNMLVSVLAESCVVPEPYQSLDKTDLKDWKLGNKQDAHFVDLLQTIKTYCLPSQLSQCDKERESIARLERMRAETERKQHARDTKEAQMINRRMSV